MYFFGDVLFWCFSAKRIFEASSLSEKQLVVVYLLGQRVGDYDDDDDDDPMILNNIAKSHTSERTIVPWMVIFLITAGHSAQVKAW